MSLQVIAEKISVYEVTGTNEFGQPVATDHIYERGQVLPDWVDGHQAFVLVNTGLAAEVGDHPDDSVRPASAAAAPVVLPEQSPAAVPGSGVTGPMVVTNRVDETSAASAGSTGAGSSSPTALSPLPQDTDTKYVWETYASSKLPVGQQMSRVEAEAMKKQDLVNEVKARYDAAAAAENEQNLPPKF